MATYRAPTAHMAPSAAPTAHMAPTPAPAAHMAPTPAPTAHKAPTPVEPADAFQNLDCFVLGIDFGSSCTKVVNKIQTKDGEHTVVRITRINQKSDIPSCIAYDRKDKEHAVYGRELLEIQHEEVEEPRIPPQDIIQCPKLLLYIDSANVKTDSTLLSGARRIIDGIPKDAEQVITDYFKLLLADVKVDLVRQYASHLTPDQIGEIPIDARVSVPQMFDLTAREVISRAATTAGIRIAHVASEPHCVLACDLDYFRGIGKTLPVRLKVGDYILIADCGCGTADFVLYRIAEELSEGSQLDAVAQASGALCGSYKVNDKLVGMLINNNAGTLRKGTGLTREGFQWHLYQAVEKAKVSSHDSGPQIITVNGPKGFVMVGKLTRKQIEEAQEETVNAIKAEMEKLTNIHMPSYTLMAGGYSKSPYLMSQVRDKYSSAPGIIQSCHDRGDSEFGTLMVARGALSPSYAAISEQSLPSRYAYICVNDMELDPNIHSDCFSKKGYPIARKTRVARSNKKTPITIDRAHIVLPKGAAGSDASKVDTGDPLWFFVPRDKPVITQRFVIAECDINENDTVLIEEHEAKRTDNPLRDGVREWVTAIARPDPTELDRIGVKKVAGRQYQIVASVIVTYKGGDNLTVGFRIFGTRDRYIDVPAEQEVWNARRSGFTMDHEDYDMGGVDDDETQDTSAQNAQHDQQAQTGSGADKEMGENVDEELEEEMVYAGSEDEEEMNEDDEMAGIDYTGDYE